MNQEIHAFDQPGEAQEFYRLKRAPVGQHAIPVERYLDADDRLKTMPVHSSGLAPSLAAWTYLGPGNIGGRTRSMIIHPTSPNIIYAGGVAGGLWKSTDAGASWNPKGDLLANLAIGCLAMDPNNSNVLYAGTGEGVFPGNDGDSVRGAGIYKSTDAGETWLLVTKTADRPDYYYVNDIVVAPSGNVYAATQTGVWRNLNGAIKWINVLNVPNLVQGCLDLAIRTDQTTDYLFASYGSFTQATIYRNTDAGGTGTWNQVYTESNMGRTSLAIAPSNQSVIYALASNYFTYGMLAVLRSTDSGNTWSSRVRDTDPTKLNTVLLTNPIFAFYNECYGQQSQYLNQGWYDNVIAVDPTDSNKVWAGGIDLFRSDDGGANWGIASHWWADHNATQYAHSDQHVIAFHPGYNGTTNKIMYVAGDGGLFRTDDAQAATGYGSNAVCNQESSVHWIALNNNYGVTQFYHGIPYPSGSTYFGGTQDNGTISSSDFAGANAWVTLLGGDGGYVAVDPTNTNTVYAEIAGNGEIPGGRFRKSTNGLSGPWDINITPGGEPGVNFLFVAPFIMDPVDPQRLWTGGRTLWRSNDRAASWCQASAPLADQGKVMTIAGAPTNPNQVLAGTWYGHIYRTSVGLSSSQNTTWDSVLLRNFAEFISCVTFDPRNANIAYATISNFDIHPTTDHHVYKSTNAGVTWTGIDGSGTTGIPDIPVHCIVVDPNDSLRLYVGTDMGVLVSLDGGATWNRENTGFANAPTEWLAVNTNGETTSLFAFTHGRGVWRVPISTALPPTGLSNLALNKTATQSSTVLGAPASRAVDGNTDGNFAGGSVTHTDLQSEAWWHVDLGNVGSIKTIQVYNRTDCCPSRLIHYYVFVSDVPFTSNVVADTLSQTGVSSYYRANSAESPTTITVNRTGRYVRVQLTGSDYLHIAEVRVWGTSYSLSSPASLTYESFAGNAGTGSISVYAPSGSPWTASSNDSFIMITSGFNGTGNGTVTYSIATNAGSTIRTGTMTINSQTFTIYQGINFLDVAPTDLFHTEIGKLSARGVTLGCAGGYYCPNDQVPHEQMAAFLMRAIGEPSPPQAPCDRFSDVSSSNIFHDFIERMGARDIWNGCGGGNYCPGNAVKREEMAAIMIRALGEFNPPYPSSQRFNDVPPQNLFYSFIDRMAVLQITLGCSAQPPMYCPGDPVTRAQMAAFLVRAFKL